MALILLGCGSKESDPPKVTTNPLAAISDERKVEGMDKRDIVSVLTLSFEYGKKVSKAKVRHIWNRLYPKERLLKVIAR